MAMVVGRPAASIEARLRFWQCRSDGKTRLEAACEAGVSLGTARRWIVASGGVRPRTPVPPSGRFLSLEERETIAEMLTGGRSKSAIARELGRDRSTIGREIERGTNARGYYSPGAADRAAKNRAKRPKDAKLAVSKRLRRFVEDKLKLNWSPRQISKALIRQFPDDETMRVSHETIYLALYIQSRGALKRELTRHLRTGRHLRRGHKRSDERRGKIPGMVNISERPAEVADRAIPGHWEGDLILGANNASAIGTLVERTTRFVMLLHLPNGHTAEQVAAAMAAKIRELPAALVRSITWDQGKEMSRHAQFTVDTGVQVYFCDPHSPWQRGTNENTNGLLRQYFPKGTDLSVHSEKHLRRVADELNGRPRETLDWHNPAEKLDELLVATTA
ncbi:IS30 family transposase [Rhodococcus sp. NPDC058532]|uniref:IS30 family transposase n=1 Tax=Rhodococcus sp. NPDC058532 TaxID=3346540 RepID=UPI00364C7E04